MRRLIVAGGLGMRRPAAAQGNRGIDCSATCEPPAVTASAVSAITHEKGDYYMVGRKD